MALSNWDLLAFQANGKPGTGELVSHDGLTKIEFYKNWLYVYSRKGKRAKWVYASMTIYEGHLSGGSWTVWAKRGPQNSIMAVVMCTDYKPGTKNKKTTFTYRTMVGVAGYGYESDYKTAIERFGDGSHVYNEENDYHNGSRNCGPEGSWMEYVGILYPDGKSDELACFSEDDFELTQWVGIKRETLAELKTYVDQLLTEYGYELHKPYFDTIQWDEAIRFNQGDMFFSNNLSVALPASAPGQAEAPFINHLLKADKP